MDLKKYMDKRITVKFNGGREGSFFSLSLFSSCERSFVVWGGWSVGWDGVGVGGLVWGVSRVVGGCEAARGRVGLEWVQIWECWQDWEIKKTDNLCAQRRAC